MMQMDQSRKEIIREEARRAKAIAVEKYKAGDFAGAKEFALKAKKLNPPLRVSGPPSTNLLDHVSQSRRSDEDTEIRRDRLGLKTSMVRSALVEKATSMINLILERSVSSSPHKYVGAALETETLQGSEKCNVAKRVKIESKDMDNVVIEEET